MRVKMYTEEEKPDKEDNKEDGRSTEEGSEIIKRLWSKLREKRKLN
jgi:hypothetical protein